MAEEDKLIEELERATGKKPGKPSDTLGKRPGVTRAIDTIKDQAAKTAPASLGAPASTTSLAFEDVERRALANAEATRQPLPSQFEGPVFEPAQRLAQRGPETQTTRFGAFDAQGNQFGPKTNQRNQAGAGNQGAALGDASGTGAQGGGTFSAVQGSDPFQQLADLRSLREPRSGGVAFAPNSRARERNARLNDPNRRLAAQLDRDVRLGRISARAARGIQQDAIASAGNVALGRDKLAADIASDRATQSFRERQLASQERQASAKLGAEVQEGILDRAQRTEQATLEARVDAAKLGETQAKRAQDESQFQRTQQFNTQKLEQQSSLKLAELMQQAAASGDKTVTARLGQVGTLLEQMNQGGDPTNIVPLIEQLVGTDSAAQILPQYYTKK